MRRPAFTLLEMLLATFVSVLLLGALYVAMELQIRHAQDGREAIEQGQLAHALLATMTKDIKLCVTPVTPTPTTSLSPPSKDGGTPATGAAAGTAAAGTGNTPSSQGTTSSSTTASTGNTIQFTLGVQGTANSLSLYISRLLTDEEVKASRTEGMSDLRLINYWLVTDGSTPIGLARQEHKRVTADEASAEPTPPQSLMAEEVKSLQFRYFDGESWFDSWDGTEVGYDGVTPLGPPLAIEITLGLVIPGGDTRYGGLPSVKYYRHVVAIPTADGLVQ
jgi:type II secretory pathway pseudopilin PulG